MSPRPPRSSGRRRRSRLRRVARPRRECSAVPPPSGRGRPRRRESAPASRSAPRWLCRATCGISRLKYEYPRRPGPIGPARRVKAAGRYHSPMPIRNPTELVQSLPRNARLLGVDVGEKTLGLALSDTTLAIASPLETLRRTKFSSDIEILKALIAKHGVGAVI